MTKQPNNLTPDEQIAAATAALETLRRDRDAFLAKQQATDPLRKFDDSIAAEEAKVKSGEQAKQAEAVKALALELRKEVAGFVEEAVDLRSALLDAAESGGGMQARLVKIHQLQSEINKGLGRDAPLFPTAEQVRVQVDIGFRSVLQDSIFAKHIDRLSPVDRRDIGGVAAGYRRSVEANWIAPFAGEEQQSTEAA